MKKRYGQPQVVARSHLMALMNLPAVKHDDPYALAKLNRTLHGAMHALRTCGYEQDLESGMTLEHVVSRSPQRMRSTWGIKVYRMAPNRATLLDLAKWIEEMVMGEMMTRPTSSKHASPYKEKKPEGSPVLKKPASLFDKKPLVFHTTSPPTVHQNPSATPSSPSAPRKSNLKKCAYCGDAHSVKSCNTFKALDVTGRAECVKEKMLCFRCLNGAHRIAECDSTAICKVEGCTQHPLLPGAPRVFPINPATSLSTTPKIKPVAMTKINNEPDDSTSLAIVPVLISANGIDFSTFAFLDQGATLNIIREDIAEKLKCSEKTKRSPSGHFTVWIQSLTL